MDEWDQKDWSICDKLGKFGIIFFLKIDASVSLQVATEVLWEAKYSEILDFQTAFLKNNGGILSTKITFPWKIWHYHGWLRYIFSGSECSHWK